MYEIENRKDVIRDKVRPRTNRQTNGDMAVTTKTNKKK